jgi:hypothetical protein
MGHRLLEDLVGAPQEGFGDGEIERLGGREVHDEFEPGRLLDRDIAGLRPAQNFVAATLAFRTGEEQSAVGEHSNG